MGVLGINLLGCTSEEEDDLYICTEPLDSYSFTIDGTVITEDGDRVTNATIKVKYNDLSSYNYVLSEEGTNQEGNFMLTGESVRVDTYKVVCIPDDPALESDSIIVEAKNTFQRYDPERNTNYGVSEATADFKLRVKNPQEA